MKQVKIPLKISLQGLDDANNKQLEGKSTFKKKL